MSVLSLSGVAAVSVSSFCALPASASVVTVIDLGPILNDNIYLPNTSDTKTAGKGESFSDYYDFTLPKAEFVSASMSTPGRRWIRFHLMRDHLILSTSTRPRAVHLHLSRTELSSKRRQFRHPRQSGQDAGRRHLQFFG